MSPSHTDPRGEQVLELAARRRRGPASGVPLIAREREMEELRDAMEEALEGHGRVVLLGGEPGIGKTRLASVLAGEAESRGTPVSWGRGWEDGSAPAFWPWNVALRRWVQQVDDEELGAATGPWAAELAHVFPALRDRLPDLPPGERWESDGARFRLFDLVSGFMRAVARPAGLVVVLDDVHWADRSSLRLLALDVGGRSGLLDAGRRNALRLALARALRGAGDVPAARRLCDAVMAACRRPADPETFARAALVYAGAMPEWGKIEPPVRAVLEEACRHGEALEDALRARLYARLAGDLIAANEVDQGPRVFALAEEAAHTARRANAPGPLAIALLATYLAWGMRMRPSSATPVAVPDPQEMLEAAVAGGEREIEPAIRYARAMTMLGCGEPEAFSAEIDGLAIAAAASRVPETLWFAGALEALRATVQGRFGDAFEAMDRAIATARRAQLPNAEGVYATQRIMCFAFQGRLGDIVGEIDAFVETEFAGPGWRPFRAIARLGSGDAVGARAEFEEMMAAGMAGADRGVMSRAYLMGLATLCVSLGDRDRAPVIYERIARRREVWSVDGCVTLGPWTLATGALARLCGRSEEAARHYETAIEQGRRMGSRPIVARGLSMLASLRPSMGVDGEERAAVGEMLDEAGRGADEMGLADVGARVARLRTARSS